MPDQIPEEIKEASRDELMLLQQEIAFEKAEERIGEEMDVFVEGRIPEEDVYVEERIWMHRKWTDFCIR